MNVWLTGSLAENPYYRTAFRITRTPREVVRRRTVVQVIGQTRRILQADPAAHAIAGKPVTPAELHAAEQVLMDPKRRLSAELLHHAAEAASLNRVSQLAKEAAAAMEPCGEAEQPAPRFKVLAPWARRLAEELLEAAPAADPRFGAAETDPPPPFGNVGRA